MAYSAADVATADRTLAAADKPMLGATVLTSVTGAEWSAAGSLAGADATATGYAAARAYDGYTDLATKPSGAGTTWYYLLDLSGSTVTFDGVAILGHNLGTPGDATVTLQIANASDFVSGLISIAEWTPLSSNDRLVDLVLESGGGTAQRYSAVPYARIVITGSSFTPEIGELVLFKRTQLQRKPNRPYNKYLTVQDAVQTRTESGVVTSITHNRGGRRLVAEVPVDTSAKVTEVFTWWDDTRQGTRPFVWVEDPASAPSTSTFLMSLGDNPELAFDEVGPNFHMLGMDAIEQGPDFQRLE